MNAKQHLQKLEALQYDEQKIAYLSTLDDDMLQQVLKEDSKNEIKK